MKKLINLSIIFVLLLGFIPQATAIASVTTLWEQLPDGMGEVESNYDANFYAEDFVVTAAASITQIEIWNSMANPVEIYYFFRANTLSGGYNIPGETVDNGMLTSSVTLEDSSICSDVSCQYRHTINLSSPVELVAGHYWLQVLGWYDSNFSWSYGSAPTDYPTYAWTPLAGPWDGTSAGGLAFRLLGPQACSASIEVQNANNDGAGSLREAIIDICPGGTITFNSTLSGATITLSSQLTLDKDVIIDGSALTEKVTISGNNMVRVFNVMYGYTVTVDTLIITGGNNENGGGINNGGTLSINNSSLVNNTGLIGGGIINYGTLSITNSTLSLNTASNGGALTNHGTATLTGCTISDNQAEGGAGIDASNEILTVRDSTFSGNVASLRGGGIYVSPGSTANVFGSTFLNNTAGDMGGGGIINFGTTSVVNSTFTGNVTGSLVRGSAINNSVGGNLTLYNSTLSENTGFVTLNNETGSMSLANTIIANTTSGWDCSTYDGTLIESANNWVSDGATGETCGATNFGDPMLAALADNGGPTQTMALQAGSGAIDAGDDTICTGILVGGVDQRGVTRPQGAHCDIGAFELEPSDLWQQLPGGESQVASFTGSSVAYEDFVLTQSATIRQVEFWSSTPDPGMIYFGYYENTTDGSGNDIPGASISSYGNTSMVTEEDPLICSQSYCTYRHSLMDDTTLGPGHYWIRIQGDSELYWSSAADTSGSYAYYPDGATSPTLSSGNLAFQLLEYVSPKITSIFIEPTFPGMPTWINVNFTDPDSGSHTAAVDWGDGIIDDADYCGYDYCNFPEHIYTEAGTYTVQVWVTDDQGNTGTLSTQYVVSYVMVPVYTEEWLASDTETTIIELEGAALEGHSPLNFTIVTNPEQHGTFGIPSSSMCEFLADWGVYLCKGSVVYTPPTETYLGYDNFSYTVDDGQGSVSNAAMVPLYVAPNTPPTAQSSSASVSTILPSTIILSATDPDFYNYTIDRLSAFIGTGPTQGTLGDIEKVNCYLEDPEVGEPYGICYFEVEYTPNQEITGTTDSFTFSVFDTHQYSLPGTVSIELHVPVTWTVNATDDVVDDFGCDATHCSLREAVDASWPGDIIEFNLTYPDTIVLGGNDIFIDKSLVINGPGADQLAISGGAEIEDLEPWTHDRVFTVGGFELPSVTVAINGLTIRDGRSDSGGGVIVLEGSNLTMNDCVIGPNNIVTYAGGGVFNERSHLTMNRCTVTGNEGTGSLGGAGVTTAYSGATTTLVNSTVSGNITNNFGGGLFVGPGSVVSLINTTVSGNISNANYLDPYEERGGGAGIYIETVEGSDNLVYIQNSIIAGNTDMTDPATAGHEKWPDIYGEATSLGGNLIGDPTGSTTIWDWSDQVGDALDPLDPVLGALAWNTPGSTQTMALLAGSPAINAAPTCEVDIDQRGVLRPQGSACDIGAYELEQTVATGSLKITKVFDPLTSGFDGTFEINYSCDDYPDDYGTAYLKAGNFIMINGIPIGTTCIVSETSLPTAPIGWTFGTPSYSPESGTVIISSEPAEVIVTNTIVEDIQETGELKISKVFDPLTSLFSGDFTITYDCDDGSAHDGTVSLGAGESETITGIPLNTYCTVTEDTLPTPPTGWSFGLPTFYPETGIVTITEASPSFAEVTVTNTISLDTGTLTITKYFDPLTSGYGSSFAIAYDCDDGTAHDGTVNLEADGSETIPGIPTGTTCTITEPTLPEAPTGWSFGEPVFSPATGIVIVESGTQGGSEIMAPATAWVSVTNSISRDLGELKISKVFDPLTSGFTGDFTITYDCDDDPAHDGTVTLAAGESDTITGIPTGTQCTVMEPTLPTAPSGWTFGTPIFDPADGIITISETLAEVTVTNAITRDVGELKISKVFDPLTSGFTGDFTITYDCDGIDHDGTVYLAAGEYDTISGIPTGTTCHVSEGVLPEAPAGWSFNGPTYTPVNGTAIIGLITSEVVVTNTIVEDVPATGELKITKVFDPLNSGFTGDFAMFYDCGGEYWAYFSLGAGQSQTFYDIPIGSQCTVTESVLPTAPDGWFFKSPVMDPASGSVTVSDASPAYAEVVVTNAIVDVRSQVTTTRTKCSAFAANKSPDLDLLAITTAYNKKTKETYIKKITPSAFYYYAKTFVPAKASEILISHISDPSGYPYLLPTTIVYDEKCVPLSQSMATISIGLDGSVTIEFPTASAERIVYVGVSYATKKLIGYVIDIPFDGMTYTFVTALDGTEFTQDDLLVDYGTINLTRIENH